MSAETMQQMRARQRREYGDHIRPHSARCCWQSNPGTGTHFFAEWNQYAARCLLPREHFGPCLFDERRSGAERRQAPARAAIQKATGEAR